MSGFSLSGYSHSGLRRPSFDSASLRRSTGSVVGSTSLHWLIHGDPLRLLVLLRWPCRPLSRLRVGLRLPPPTQLWQLRCLVRCRSLRGPQPVAPRHLQSLNVWRSAFRHSLTCFPRVFVYRRRDVCSGCGFTSPFAAFIGCFAQCGGTLCNRRCPVATAPAFRSFMAKAAASYSVLLRSLVMFLLVICFMHVPA